MKKEEIRETKHAYRRDKRYLKTNFTPESYARQCVIDNMLLEYKIDYKMIVRRIAESVKANTRISYKGIENAIGKLSVQELGYDYRMEGVDVT